MLLTFSTPDFKIHNVSYNNFPILLNDQMEIVEVVFYFLIKHCIKRGRVKSEKSWEVYGRAVYDYFSFLNANGLSWNNYGYDRDHTILAAYRDWSISEKKLSVSTVNLRLGIIVKFYQYAFIKQWVNSVPYDLEDVIAHKPKGFLAHTDASGGTKRSPDIMLKTQQTRYKVLSKQEIKQFLIAVKNPTQKLMARLSLCSGPRKEEIVTFPLKYVVNPEKLKSKGLIRVDLNPAEMKTKGDKPRGIDIPRKLMEDLWQYVLHERHQLENISGEKHSTLFLNKNGVPWANSGRCLNNLWSNLGLPFQVYPHILRHTYATHTLYDMKKRQSQTDPLLYVRDRLGHSSIYTTEKYLHYLSEVKDNLMTDYQKEIDDICMAGAQDV